MATIQEYASPQVYAPPTYAQAIKVTGAQTLLFIAGQVAYDDQGGPAHGGDFIRQAREVFRSVQAQVEAGGGTLRDVVGAGKYLHEELGAEVEVLRADIDLFDPFVLATVLRGNDVLVSAFGAPQPSRRSCRRQRVRCCRLRSRPGCGVC